MTIREGYSTFAGALSDRYGSGEAASLARIVFEDVFHWHQLQADRPMGLAELDELHRIQTRLLSGEPLQYILGEADFFGLKFKVSPGVLIPRQETEELVGWALSSARQWPKDQLSLLDIGTGSGCIALSFKKKWPSAQVEALDISQEALSIARGNAQRLMLDVEFYQADIRELALQEQTRYYDFIISNPPYIPRSESVLMPEHVLAHEPELALFVDHPDPLLFYRCIMQFAARQLNAGGWLFFECNEFNAPDLLKLPEAAAFSAISIRQDISGKDRIWRGQKNQ